MVPGPTVCPCCRAAAYGRPGPSPASTPSNRPSPTSRRMIAPFFCSTQAWSFLRYARERVTSRPSARRRVAPVVERPHRHAPAHHRAEPRWAATSAASHRTHPGQQAIDAVRTHRQQLGPCRLVQRHAAVPLQSRQQHRQHRPQPLRADPVRHLPQLDQRVPDLHAIGSRARPRRQTRPVRLLLLAQPRQQPDRMLAMIARDRRELVEDARPLRSRSTPIRPSDRLQQLPPRRHSNPPRHLLPSDPARARQQIT